MAPPTKRRKRQCAPPLGPIAQASMVGHTRLDPGGGGSATTIFSDTAEPRLGRDVGASVMALPGVRKVREVVRSEQGDGGAERRCKEKGDVTKCSRLNGNDGRHGVDSGRKRGCDLDLLKGIALEADPEGSLTVLADGAVEMAELQGVAAVGHGDRVGREEQAADEKGQACCWDDVIADVAQRFVGDSLNDGLRELIEVAYEGKHGKTCSGPNCGKKRGSRTKFRLCTACCNAICACCFHKGAPQCKQQWEEGRGLCSSCFGLPDLERLTKRTAFVKQVVERVLFGTHIMPDPKNAHTRELWLRVKHAMTENDGNAIELLASEEDQRVAAAAAAAAAESSEGRKKSKKRRLVGAQQQHRFISEYMWDSGLALPPTLLATFFRADRVFQSLTHMRGYDVNATSRGCCFGDDGDKQARVPLLHLAIMMVIINQDSHTRSLNILRTVLEDKNLDKAVQDWEGRDYLDFARRWKAPHWLMADLQRPDPSVDDRCGGTAKSIGGEEPRVTVMYQADGDHHETTIDGEVAHCESPWRIVVNVSREFGALRAYEHAGLIRMEGISLPLRMDELELAHAPMYLKRIWSMDAAAPAPGEGLTPLDAAQDTFLCQGSFNTAAGAGGVVKAAVLKALATRTLIMCIVRPPGHHAGREGYARHRKVTSRNETEDGDCCGTQGFCVINNAIVGLLAAFEDPPRALSSVLRVAFIDLDKHHGDGTHDLARFVNAHGRWLGKIVIGVFDLFFAGFIPQRGSKRCERRKLYPGFTWAINEDDRYVCEPVDVAKHKTEEERRAAWWKALDTVILPGIHSFEPNLILVCGGVDGHHQDDGAEAAGGALQCCDYHHALKKITDMADKLEVRGGSQRGRLREARWSCWNLRALVRGHGGWPAR